MTDKQLSILLFQLRDRLHIEIAQLRQLLPSDMERSEQAMFIDPDNHYIRRSDYRCLDGLRAFVSTLDEHIIVLEQDEHSTGS